MRMRIAGPLAVLLLVSNTGCLNLLMDPMGRKSALKEVQLKYTQAIRWGDIRKAAEFVDPELREKFLSFVDEFEAIRITDYDIGTIQYDSTDRADVIVTYHAYTVGTFLDRSITENQRWHREGMGTQWWVKPQIESIVGAASVSAH